MQIIPVIDLKDGQVVHAVRGDRDHYPPIHLHSCLTSSSDVETVLANFLAFYPFERFYIADLNAITGNGDHRESIDRLVRRYSDIDFWVDDGRQLPAIEGGHSNKKTVIGTESQHAFPVRTSHDFILSLDFNHRALGHPAWFDTDEFWPSQVIVMSLNRVGGNTGPDFEKLAELVQAYPDIGIVAAGGIRNTGDLRQLSRSGVDAVLIATSLHTGAITASDIREFQTKKYPGKPGYF